ncbi:MAG TPA: clostripain-related cysteine peptidase [Kofleriaceae bacterium]
MTTSGWNVLVYAIGRTAEDHKRVTDAIAQMHEATTERCHIAVQLHGHGRTTRYWSCKPRKLEAETLPVPANAAEPSSLTSFLNTAHRRLPTAPVALVLWAHSSGLDHLHDYPRKQAPHRPGLDSVFGAHDPGGLGGAPGLDDVFGGAAASHAMPMGFGGGGGGGGIAPWREAPGRRTRMPAERYGCRWGPDPNTGEFLTNVGMKKAIAGSSRRRVEVLGLNACWMASLEIEYELRGVSDVQIASQVSAQPWPYRAIVEAIAAAPALTTEQLARAIVASVHDEITAGTRHDAISALSSGAAMDQLAAAFDRYARRAMALIESDWESVSKAVMKDAQRVDDPYQVDLMSLVRELGKDDVKAKIAAAAVETHFHAMRLAHTASTTHPNVHGLSLFCPKTTHVDLTDAYRGTEFRTNTWAQFLQAFQIRLPRTPGDQAS